MKVIWGVTKLCPKARLMYRFIDYVVSSGFTIRISGMKAK